MTLIKKKKNKRKKSIISSLSNNICLGIIIGVIITVAAAKTSLSSIRMSFAASSGINASRFVGEWKLKEIWDDNDNPRKLPTSSSNDGEPFILKLGKPGDDNKSLNLYIKIRNSMRSSIEFLDSNNGSNKIHVGDIFGTKLYPGKELMGLENYLSTYLPRMVLIEIKDTLLIMTAAGAFSSNNNLEGRGNGIRSGGRKIGHAKIVCEAVEYIA
jgi:hypothetical protein